MIKKGVYRAGGFIYVFSLFLAVRPVAAADAEESLCRGRTIALPRPLCDFGEFYLTPSSQAGLSHTNSQSGSGQ